MLQIADDVFQLALTPRDGVNAYLVGDLLVDTGIKQSLKKLRTALAGRTISAIVLTHAHVDHAGSVAALAAEQNVPVWTGAADKEATETGDPVPGAPLQRPVLRTIGGYLGSFDGTDVARTLTEGDEIGPGFTVLDTPGHSPGHISLWRASDRTLICGDVFNNMNLITTVPGLHQPPSLFNVDSARNRESERKLAALSPTTMAVGHGPVLRDGTAAKLQAFIAALPAG